MRKILSMLTIGLLCLSTSMILAPKAISEVSLPWKDDFNYNTLDEMKAAGWTLYNEERMSLSPSVIRLDNDGTVGCSMYFSGHFPTQVFEFSVEARMKWVGRAYGQCVLLARTQRHGYLWYGDGYYPEYSFIRDDVKVLRFGGYTPILNGWTTFALHKRGNTFYMYQDGELQNTYIETDTTPDELVEVGLSCGWISTMEYDYISVTALGHIPATVDIDPDALNLRSRGKWITAYIELPEDYNVSDIDVSSILLNDTIPAGIHPVDIGDYDNDGIPDLMVKFDRAEVASYILVNVNMTQLIEERFMTIALTITGYLNDETLFEGSDIVRVIMPGAKGAGKRTTRK